MNRPAPRPTRKPLATDEPFAWARFLAPRHWPIWVGLGLMRLLAALPLRMQWAVGRAIGAIGYRVARARAHIARVNLELVYPTLDPDSRENMVRDVFRHTGLGMVETAMAWFRDPRDFADRFDFEGFEWLEAAQVRGNGVLLIGTHFSTLEIVGALLGHFVDFDVTYRAHKSPLYEAVMQRGRARRYGGVIERRELRTFVRRLRAGRTVWYAADQDYGRRHSVFAPFFGIPTATVTATMRLCRMTGAEPVGVSYYRDLTRGRWTIRFTPLEDFPVGDDETDAARLNAWIEAEVRRAPAQYLWVHRRFKTRPPGEARPY